jgi:hypothetical protein
MDNDEYQELLLQLDGPDHIGAEWQNWLFVEGKDTLPDLQWQL